MRITYTMALHLPKKRHYYLSISGIECLLSHISIEAAAVAFEELGML